ncbi:MAG: hypothetical protein ACE5EH_05850 [Gammaproteobacteria bacterium]
MKTVGIARLVVFFMILFAFSFATISSGDVTRFGVTVSDLATFYHSGLNVPQDEVMAVILYSGQL